MPHRQRLDLDSHWRDCLGHRIHVHTKGWMTVSKTGKSVLWDDYKPPTKREIDAENKRRIKLNEWHRSPAGRASAEKTDRFLDNLFARNGTSRAKIAATILKVIEDAPPFASVAQMD